MRPLNDKIEVVCHECKAQRFFVLDPGMDLPYDHGYWSCYNCFRERRLDKEGKIYAKNKSEAPA